MNTDMALGYDDKTAPAAGVFFTIPFSKVDFRPCQDMHIEHIRQLLETVKHKLFIIEFLRIPAVSIQCEVLAKVLHKIKKPAFV